MKRCSGNCRVGLDRRWLQVPVLLQQPASRSARFRFSPSRDEVRLEALGEVKSYERLLLAVEGHGTALQGPDVSRQAEVISQEQNHPPLGDNHLSFWIVKYTGLSTSAAILARGWSHASHFSLPTSSAPVCVSTGQDHTELQHIYALKALGLGVLPSSCVESAMSSSKTKGSHLRSSRVLGVIRRSFVVVVLRKKAASECLTKSLADS